MNVSKPGDRDGLRYLVALIEIWGGLYGLWGFIRDFAQTYAQLPPVLLPGIGIILLTLVASLVAGVALWHDRRYGFAVSVPVQLAQVIWFATPSLTFRVNASGWMLVDLFWRNGEKAGVGVQFDLIHKVDYAISVAGRADTVVAVNLVALAILGWLALRLRTRTRP